MAKKGGQLQLLVEVENEEDWEKLVKRPGLIVVDVYSEWCGSCTGIAGFLRKIKLEIGGDILTLATAKSDYIECLERFRNKSEPTWMFISGGKMIRLMFGANAPRLVSIITDEIYREKQAMADRRPREGIRFDQLTDEEQERADEEQLIQDEIDRIEREARENAINERRDAIINNLIDPLKDYNFVMTWPHVTNEKQSQIYEAMKEAEMSVGGKHAKMVLTDEDIAEMLHFCEWNVSEDAWEEAKKKEITGLLFQAPLIDFDGDVVEITKEKLYGSSKEPPGDEDSVAQKLCTMIEKEVILEGIELVEGEEEEDGVGQSSFMQSIMQVKLPEEESSRMLPEMMQVEIPGIFIPDNVRTKVCCMRILFPYITTKYDLPEPEPIPPHLIIAFDAFKKNEILQLASEYPTETMKYGFFTKFHNDVETAELICKNENQFDNISGPPTDAKLIIQVSKRKSEPLLSYSLLGPTYVSHNTVVGERECAVLFPEGYDEPEPEPEVEEVKKKPKKRHRASRTSGASGTPSRTSDESGSNLTDEGLEDALEDVMEEEEGSEDNADVGSDELALLGIGDGMDFDFMVPPPEMTELAPPAEVAEEAAGEEAAEEAAEPAPEPEATETEADKATSPMPDAP